MVSKSCSLNSGHTLARPLELPGDSPLMSHARKRPPLPSLSRGVCSVKATLCCGTLRLRAQLARPLYPPECSVLKPPLSDVRLCVCLCVSGFPSHAIFTLLDFLHRTTLYGLLGSDPTETADPKGWDHIHPQHCLTSQLWKTAMTRWPCSSTSCPSKLSAIPMQFESDLLAMQMSSHLCFSKAK